VFFFIANGANTSHNQTSDGLTAKRANKYNTKDDNQYSRCSEPLTSPYIVKTANAVSLNLLPKKSKERYIIAYEKLLKLRKINETKSL
jgi:hypothetical protein